MATLRGDLLQGQQQQERKIRGFLYTVAVVAGVGAVADGAVAVVGTGSVGAGQQSPGSDKAGVDGAYLRKVLEQYIRFEVPKKDTVSRCVVCP